MLVAQSHCNGNDLPCVRSLRKDSVVLKALNFFRPIGKVNGKLARRKNTAGKVLPDFLRHERNNRSHNFYTGVDCVEQYPVCKGLVLFIAGFPEAAAVGSDVPVGDIVNKNFKFLDDIVCFEVVHLSCGFSDELVRSCNKPTVGNGHCALVGSISLKVRLVNSCVGFKESVGIPERKELSSGLVSEVESEADIVRNGCAGIHISDSIGADFFRSLVKADHEAGFGEL